MRHNQNNRRSRGRSRKGPNPLTRSFESNGPDVKVRGTASHIAEKYMALARDALSSGDNVAAENYFQHAEHYNRIIAAAQAQAQQAQPDFRQRDGGDDESYDGERTMNGRSMDFGRDEGSYRPDSDGDGDTDETPAPQQASQQQPVQQQSAQQEASQQQPSEPERPRRRRRPRSEDQAEASAPRGRRGEKKAAPAANGADQSEEDTTNDGQAALAAFPD